MISVVIPLYNKEKQIKRTLQSVLTQTFQDFEIVIVNDGSTDNSTIEVEKIKDSRIRLIHQENAGVSAARNKGIEEAKYELIALLDAKTNIWKFNMIYTKNIRNVTFLLAITNLLMKNMIYRLQLSKNFHLKKMMEY